MPFSKGRIHRLLRAEGLDPADPSWASFGRALGRYDSAAEVRADLLCQLRAMDRRSAAAAPVEAWLRDQPPIAVPVDDFLGAHELITGLVARTVAWCAARDLDRSLPRETCLAWARELVAAAPPDDLLAAQSAFVAHRDPDAIIHFHRVWPEGADLSPLRRAYLDRLLAHEPGLDRTRSVVGHIEVTVHGTAEEKQRLVDWTRSTSRRLVLACGVEIETERGAGTERTCFSVSDLGDRGHDTAAHQLGDGIDAVGTGGDELLELWDLRTDAEEVGLGFPAVDRLLRILARAALGRRDAAEVLPPVPPLRPVPLPRLPDVEVTARIARDLWPIVAGWNEDPRQLRRALPLVLAVDSPLTSAAQDALRAEGTEESWRRALHALALWRWVEGFGALCEEAERGGNPSFHDVAGEWLADRCPWGFRPRDRVRKPRAAAGEDGRRYNAFLLTPEDSPTDGALVRLAWPYRRAWWSGTWLVNQWPAASNLVTHLVRESGLADGGRDGLLWAHCLAFATDPAKAYDGFKVRVAEVGRVPWSLDELAEWTMASRPSQESLRSWRLRNAARAVRLPGEPWSAKSCWTRLGRDLRWIGDRLWPQGALLPLRRSSR